MGQQRELRIFTYISHAIEVQEVRWWMGSYGSATPKRHVAFANSCEILNLDKGKLVGWKKTEKTKVKTVEHYQDRHGKQRWKGTSKLRSTEFLALFLNDVDIFLER